MTLQHITAHHSTSHHIALHNVTLGFSKCFPTNIKSNFDLEFVYPLGWGGNIFVIIFRGGEFSRNFWLEVCILFSISAIGWKSKNPEPIGRSGRIGATAIQTPSQILYLIPLWGESKKIPYKNQVKFLTWLIYRKKCENRGHGYTNSKSNFILDPSMKGV